MNWLKTILFLFLFSYLEGFSQLKESKIDTLKIIKPSFHSLIVDSLSKSYSGFFSGGNIKKLNVKSFSTGDSSTKNSTTTFLNHNFAFNKGLSPGIEQLFFNGRLKNLMQLPANIYKNPIALVNAKTHYDRIDNEGSYVNPSGRAWYGDFVVSSSWSIATIPFDVQFNNQAWNDLTNNNISNLGIHFNKDSYLQMLKKNLKDKFNPEEFLTTDIRDQINNIKQNAGASLKTDLEKINQGFGNQLNDKISELGNLKNLMSNDMHAVREQLLNSQYIQSITDKEKLLAELQNKKNTGQAVDEKELGDLQNEVAKLKGVNALIQKVEEHKGKWESSGVIKKIKQLDLLDKKQLDKIASDPTTVIKQANKHLQLNGLQKLFLKLNQFNIGQNTLSESRLSVQHLLNKGFNTELVDKNKSLMVGMGKLKTFNSILDQPFTNSVLSNDGNAKMISVGIGKSSGNNSHFSLMTYSQSMGALDNFSSINGLTAGNTFRSTVVTTISNELTLGERGSITAELSRSATTYLQTIDSDTTLAGKSASEQLLNSDNLLNSMAFSLKYEDEFADQDLSYGLHAGMTAPGYNNPGSTFLTSGGKEFGVNVRKAFWKRKLQASVKTDMREYNFGDDESKKWRSLYSILDLRMKLKKGRSIGIRYMPNKMMRVQGGEKSTVSLLERLSVDGTVAQKISDKYYRNNITLAWQKNKYIMGDEPVLNYSLSVSSFQSITLNSKLLFVNTLYDHARNNSQYVFFNSTFLTETGITWLLLKNISMSSSLLYNCVKDWYNQVGIKQTISGQLKDRFSCNIYVDARKNLKLYQPLMYGLFRADISVNYLIKR